MSVFKSLKDLKDALPGTGSSKKSKSEKTSGDGDEDDSKVSPSKSEKSSTEKSDRFAFFTKSGKSGKESSGSLAETSKTTEKTEDADDDGEVDNDEDKEAENDKGAIDDDAPPDAFSEKEVQAAKEVKKILLEKLKLSPELISVRELMVITMNSKLRPETAAEKYKKWLDIMGETAGINSYQDVFSDVGYNCENLAGHEIENSVKRTYACCGRDKEDRSVMWINTRPVPVEEENSAVKSSVMYFMAAHSDLETLRNGITFVLDTSNNDMQKKVGNEAKLQRNWQTTPIRPQRIYILGANMIKRALINTAIAVAALFTKDKLVRRIRFAELDEVKKEIDDENLPVHAGGKNAGRADGDALVKWIQERLANFPPLPNLDD